MTTYFQTSFQAGRPNPKPQYPPYPPSANAIYVGPQQLATVDPGVTLGPAAAWEIDEGATGGGNLIVPLQISPVDGSVTQSVAVAMTQAQAQSLGNWIATVGYGGQNNTVGVYTNGLAVTGYGVSRTLFGDATNEALANGYVYFMQKWAAQVNAKDAPISLNDWATIIFVGTIALAATIATGPIGGLAAGAAAGTLFGSSPAQGAAPDGIFQIDDANENWALDDTLSILWGGNEDYSDTENDWDEFF